MQDGSLKPRSAWSLLPGFTGLCKLWIFEFCTFVVLKVSDSEYNKATVDFLLDHGRWQTRELYELVCKDFYEITAEVHN